MRERDRDRQRERESEREIEREKNQQGRCEEVSQRLPDHWHEISGQL